MSSPTAADLCAQFADNQIQILLPPKMMEDWADTEKIGLHVEQKIGDMTVLRLLIEKDFLCSDRPTDPDKKDAFLPPRTKC